MSRIMGFIHDHVAAAGHDVNYFCTEDMPQEMSPRWKRLLFPVYIRRHVSSAAARGEPYDIVNVHEPSSAATVVRRGPLGNPIVVVTTHGLEQRSWELSLEEGRLGREGPSWRSKITSPLIGRWQCAVGLGKADHIFCLNFEDRDFLRRRMQIPEDRITRIYPGAQPIFAEAATTRDYTGSSRLLFAGSWRKNKGIEDMIPAFAELARRHADLTLTVLDISVSIESIRANFAPEIAARVHSMSTKDEAATASVYAANDILVMPSLFEGTPLTLVEAMMSGMPIVTTATCGMKDVIRDDELGLLIPIRSPESIVAAFERLRADETLRERLGRAARREAEAKYTWRQVSEPILQTYERLMRDAR
jgi:glycosyltransferase involved in cell wall biosynthesis